MYKNRTLKRLLWVAGLLFALFVTQAQAITITKAQGWLESAYLTWQPVLGAEKYNVYITGEGLQDYRIDELLIRNYGTYLRADVLGLKQGNYTLKVKAVVGGQETLQTETGSLTVLAHDRSGFAFSNGRIPGAYKADGTPKDNAIILYVTENNKNTISMNVTGANSNPCVGLQTILDAFKKGKDARPLIIRLIGQITDLSYMLGGDIVIENNNNAASYITMEGVGDDAVVDGWGIRIKNASNVEVRNLGFMNCDSSEGDNVGLQQDNDYIWVHHCDMFYGNAGSDADQIKGDGALDCKKSTYVTFSYNHFWDSGKSNLLGLSEGTTAGLYITYHHNWYDHSDSRHPRVRYYSAHVYNNYYDGVAKYGVGSTEGASVFVEKNYFRNCKYPMMISMQGTDTKNGTDEKNSPTFSKENGGIIKAFDNYMTGNYTFVPYSTTNTIHFDAYVANIRDEAVAGTITTKQGGNSYNNFDTNTSLMYNYTPHETNQVVGHVTQYAGRIEGGDFKWVFNNAVDDVSYDVNTPLKAALITYKTKLVSIQGDSIQSGGGENPGGGDPGENPGGGEVTPGDYDHNFTKQGTNSSFYKITGSLSTGYGSMEYAGQNLTQCLKIESSTLINFTTTTEGTITLVFKPDFTGRVKIDDVSYTAVAGKVTATLPAGTHKITKHDTSYLFYMSYSTTSGKEQQVGPSIQLYPNPVSDYLHIQTTDNIHSILILSSSGELLKSYSGDRTSIAFDNMPNGVYLVRLQTDKSVVIRHVIKK